jgi:hypothetical protein
MSLESSLPGIILTATPVTFSWGVFCFKHVTPLAASDMCFYFGHELRLVASAHVFCWFCGQG